VKAIRTVADLLTALEGLPDQTPVVLATQPPWPFTHTIAAVHHADDGTVYLAEGPQLDYLPERIRRLFDW
jgi:hypothetical protein